MSNWNIRLGYCGPIDCCLVLVRPDGQTKEYLIETYAWDILGKYWSMQAQSGRIPASVAQTIWDSRDGDLRPPIRR